MSVEILKKNNFKFNKNFGQNFIFDQNFLDSIVSPNVDKTDEILEIGAGAGTLTKTLSRFSKRVVSYEIDNNLKDILAENLADCDNIELTFKDIMKEETVDIDNRFNNEFVLFANLPYYITTPIIFKFLKESKKLKSMYIMVQKEVADRIVANKGGKDYGVLTVSIQSMAAVKIVKRVPRTMFMPVPNVDSAIVEIKINRSNLPGNLDMDNLFRVISDCFSMRRKTLENNLKKYSQKGYDINQVLQDCGIKPGSRAESLSVEDFIKLAERLQ